MASHKKTLQQVLLGTSDSNVPFGDLRKLLKRLGFKERTKGSHRIFVRDGVDEILNLQPKGSKAKAYQVKQFRDLIVRYELVSDEEGE